MTLEEKLEIWHQNNEYQKIIDELEKIPASRRSHELTGLLARAYENAANGTERPEYHLHAIELLLSAVEEEDPNWNFRMGFALYWLDREEEAVPYFEKIFTRASGLLPGPGGEEAQPGGQRALSRLVRENLVRKNW